MSASAQQLSAVVSYGHETRPEQQASDGVSTTERIAIEHPRTVASGSFISSNTNRIRNRSKRRRRADSLGHMKSDTYMELAPPGIPVLNTPSSLSLNSWVEWAAKVGKLRLVLEPG